MAQSETAAIVKGIQGAGGGGRSKSDEEPIKLLTQCCWLNRKLAELFMVTKPSRCGKNFFGKENTIPMPYLLVEPPPQSLATCGPRCSCVGVVSFSASSQVSIPQALLHCPHARLYALNGLINSVLLLVRYCFSHT